MSPNNLLFVKLKMGSITKGVIICNVLSCYIYYVIKTNFKLPHSQLFVDNKTKGAKI